MGTEWNHQPVVKWLQAGQKQHDLETFSGYFEPDDQSEQLVHPNRVFRGQRCQAMSHWPPVILC
jgi:hypothetical protein